MTEKFNIQTPVFQGPLELLLDLIEKRKLLINEISLAKVADDYISHIRNLGNFPISDSANFILISSTLLLIKSKSLLPSLELSTDEKANMDDLERRLKIYKKMKELSIFVKNLFGKQIIYTKSFTPVITVFSPDSSMTITNLVLGMNSVLQNLPKKQLIPKAVVQKVISLEEMIGNLAERVKRNLKMSFKEFSGASGKKERVNIIVSFLAMLELVKQGIINVTQETHKSDILMENTDVGVPRYN